MLGALGALEVEERSIKAHCLQRARQVSSTVYPQKGAAGVLATPSARDIAAAINVVRDDGGGALGLPFPEMPMEAAATPVPPYVEP